jgi:hypothetical protein
LAIKSRLFTAAGTIIDLGIDYFAGGPGTVQKNSREGKLIAGFVEAIDGIASRTGPR